MTRTILASVAAVLALAGSAAPVLQDFKGVYKAQVEREGTNQGRVVFPSAEWGTGIKWESAKGEDFSSARYLAVDVENLSKRRQSRITMHVSAGGADGDSGDHAVAILKKNRSVNTGIGLNPGEKRTMRLLLTHPSIYGAPEGARGPYVIDTSHVTSIHFQMQWPYEEELDDLADLRFSNLRLDGTPDLARKVDPAKYVPFVDKYGQFAHADWRFKVKNDETFAKDLAAERKHLKDAPEEWDRFGGWKDGPKLRATGHFRTEKVDGKWWLVTPEGHLFFSVGLDVTRVMTDISNGKLHPDWYESPVPEDGKMAFTIWNLEKKFGRKDFDDEYYDFVLKRFDSWGLNTIGNWSAGDLTIKSRKPYVMSVLERAKGVTRMQKFQLYDFSAPDFEQNFRAAIREKFARSRTRRRIRCASASSSTTSCSSTAGSPTSARDAPPRAWTSTSASAARSSTASRPESSTSAAASLASASRVFSGARPRSTATS